MYYSFFCINCVICMLYIMYYSFQMQEMNIFNFQTRKKRMHLQHIQVQIFILKNIFIKVNNHILMCQIRGKFKTLSRMSKDILSIQMTSITFEAAFSSGGQVINGKEALICTGNQVRQLCKYYYKNYNFDILRYI